jgi:hypothetical protein
MKDCTWQLRSVLSKAVARCDCAARWLERGSSFRFVLALVFSLTLLATGARASDTILYNFAGTPDGAASYSTPVADRYGNLYGTTVKGGANNLGSVFVMCAPLPTTSLDILPCTPGSSVWTEFVLYSFQGVSFSDGANPYGTLVFGNIGPTGRAFTLYGTTYNGGGNASGLVCGGNTGCGTVFELCAPSSSGGCSTSATSWQEKVLHSFSGGTDGAFPFAGVITDKASNVYGTTVYGGSMGTCLIGSTNWRCGTAFKLKPNATYTSWAETIMHRFKGGADGANPYAALCCNSIFAIPYFYGTTLRGGTASSGGTGNSGIVFKLQNSPYTETILYNFCSFLGCPDGANPYANVIFDGAANMYGTTAYGGNYGRGTIYELPGPAYASEAVLYNFCTGGGICPDGAVATAGLTLDSANNLYGTTEFGGVGLGEVFVSPPPYTTVTTLQSFAGGVGDGSLPFGGVIFDFPISTISLYGATTSAGTLGLGTFYSVP